MSHYDDDNEEHSLATPTLSGYWLLLVGWGYNILVFSKT